MKSLQRTFARALVPIAVVAATVMAAVVAEASPAPDQGLHLAYENGQVVVASVDYGSAAQQSGIRPGDVVVELDGSNPPGTWNDDPHYVLWASDQTKRDLARSSGPWDVVHTVSPDGIAAYAVAQYEWAMVDVREQVQWELTWMDAQGVPRAYAVYPGALPGSAEDSYSLETSVPWEPGPLVFGLAILIVGWWWVGSGRAGTALRRCTVTLPVATAVPLLVVPIVRYQSALETVVGSVLVPLAMLPLAIDFLGRVEGRRTRRLVGSAAFVLAIGSAAASLLIPSGTSLHTWGAILAAGVAFVPGFFAARPFGRRASGADVETGATPWALSESTDVALAAMTPGIACITLTFTSVPYSYTVWPILVWLAAVWVARRFTLRPLARLATRTTRQRDLEAAAAEAERARIAANIHDDALQELTMLVRRLDVAGDHENADAARGIAARLRAICGDLRLPILDDLGVGPSLEWLVDRLDRLGGPVRLEREGDECRLPNDVELAVYRVAQEALTNAVKHGAPPIVVRYRQKAVGVGLEVDDAGPGLAPGAAELAEHTGRLGLVGMAQRAEAIGGVLTVGPRPGGGTRVKLVWDDPRAGAAAGASAVPAEARAMEAR
jgi:signal transduction histidine kinase